MIVPSAFSSSRTGGACGQAAGAARVRTRMVRRMKTVCMETSLEDHASRARPIQWAPMLRVLVVDDEKNIRSTLALALESAGCTVGLAANAESALAHAEREPFDLALVDLKLAESSGLDLIPRLVGASPGLDIVVITAYATIDTAVEAMRRGAVDYLAKPFTPAQIRHLVDRTTRRRALVRQVRDL